MTEPDVIQVQKTGSDSTVTYVETKPVAELLERLFDLGELKLKSTDIDRWGEVFRELKTLLAAIAGKNDD